MTKEQIQDKLNAIKALSWDHEAAHSLEDELYHDFITYISNSLKVHKDVSEMALLVLSSKKIEFPRYTA